MKAPKRLIEGRARIAAQIIVRARLPADRSRIGLMDGAGVTIVDRSVAEWVHVRTDTGQEGWLPARYVSP